jgi:catechol 2,3-dioxygenase-like lactoylglutathione lyase family enzyme
MQLGTLLIELIPNDSPAMQSGAVDHFCLDVKDIDTLYARVRDAGYHLLSDGIQDIAFWDKGARYFFIQGPNNEKIEFCEILR